MKAFFTKHKLATVLIIAFAVTGAAVLGASFAASPVITGRVYDTRTGSGIANVSLTTCNNKTISTNSNGDFSVSFSVGTNYCIRIASGIPAGWTGPVTVGQRPGHSTASSYEAQVAGVNCYQVASCSTVSQSWDHSNDSLLNFRYTSPTPAPTTKVCWDGKTYPIAQACPAQPKPAPKPVTKTTPKTTTTKPKTSTPTTPTPAADTAAPSTPQNLVATVDSTSKSIHLAWQASTDNVGVAAYQLERSADAQQNWNLLSNNITKTSYDDLTAAFGTSYYYRLKAVDAAGNVSDYAAAQISTSTFESNAKPDSEVSLTSDDNVATVSIPAGALSQEAFCSLMQSTDIQLPQTDKYIFVSGPYVLSCRDQSSNLITSFNKPFVLSAHVNGSNLKGVKQLVYFGQKDDESWQILKITKHDKKTSTDTVNLENYRTFSIMGSKKKTPIWVKILEILIVLIALLFLARFIVRLLLKRKAADEYDEYLRKAKGL